MKYQNRKFIPIQIGSIISQFAVVLIETSYSDYPSRESPEHNKNVKNGTRSKKRQQTTTHTQQQPTQQSINEEEEEDGKKSTLNR